MIETIAARRFFALCERISVGSLEVIAPDGAVRRFGEPSPDLKDAALHIHDWAMAPIIAQRGDIGLGETYVAGMWDSPDVEALLALLLANEEVTIPLSSGSVLRNLIFRFTNAILRRNNRAGSSRNIRAHYDVGNDFYKLWLDPTMTYSSALYGDDETSLEGAQNNKYDRLLSLLPETCDRVLEIGCGWGGFAERAADAGRRVTGLTVSPAQRKFAMARLGERADIRLQDYRDVKGEYASIVSIEMIEAVGEQYWPTYFETIKQRLAAGGRAALQAIIVEDGSFDLYRRQSDFIRQYIFPGGMLIPPQRIHACAERAGLVVDSFHRFGEDYARTLRHWLQRLNAAASDIRTLGYSEQNLRSWRYYMEFCAAGFTHGKHINVAQLSLSHA
ncbi:MAG: cyclopropane-fatty-acyl-phospholipid synthase family protein [Pseudomonadota bacterium]